MPATLAISIRHEAWRARHAHACSQHRAALAYLGRPGANVMLAQLWLDILHARRHRALHMMLAARREVEGVARCP